MKQIKATDIEPNKLYLYGKTPVKIVCTESCGWKRGYVDIHRHWDRLHATATSVHGGQTFQIMITFTGSQNEMVLSELREFDQKKVGQRLAQLSQYHQAVQRELDMLQASLLNF